MQLTEGMKVKVYYNLHKRCFSVQHKGRVVAHVDDLALEECTFPVNEKARQRVVATKRKEVHAYIKGTITRDWMAEYDAIVEGADIGYNPYKAPTFVVKHNGEPVHQAKAVALANYHTGPKMWATL